MAGEEQNTGGPNKEGPNKEGQNKEEPSLARRYQKMSKEWQRAPKANAYARTYLSLNEDFNLYEDLDKAIVDENVKLREPREQALDKILELQLSQEHKAHIAEMRKTLIESDAETERLLYKRNFNNQIAELSHQRRRDRTRFDYELSFVEESKALAQLRLESERQTTADLQKRLNEANQKTEWLTARNTALESAELKRLETAVDAMAVCSKPKGGEGEQVPSSSKHDNGRHADIEPAE
jgi:hypothetical protein